MAILKIERFMLRHNGTLYTKGMTVDLPDDEAKALAERSAGAFVIIGECEEYTVAAEDEPTEAVELPAVEPEKISTKKKKAKK